MTEQYCLYYVESIGNLYLLKNEETKYTSEFNLSKIKLFSSKKKVIEFIEGLRIKGKIIPFNLKLKKIMIAEERQFSLESIFDNVKIRTLNQSRTLFYDHKDF